MNYYSGNAVIFVVILGANLILLGFPVALGVGVAFKLTRHASARGRYLIAVAAFFITSLLPIVVTLNAFREATPGPLTPHSNQPPTAISQTSVGVNVEVGPLPHAAQRPSTKSLRVVIAEKYVRAINYFGSLVINIPWAEGLIGIWVSITAVMIGRETIGLARLARARRTWQPATENLRRELAWPKATPLYMSDGEGPCAIGLLRGAVVIPLQLFAEVPLEVLRCIARHEVAHVKWHDPLANSLLRIVRAVLWPSLPLWYLERTIRLEQEAAADRAAVTPRPPNNVNASATEYVLALVSIAKGSGRRLMASEVGSRSGLEDRVRRLLATPPRLALIRFSCAALIIFVSVLGMSALLVASQPSVLGTTGGSSIRIQLGGESSMAESRDDPYATHGLESSAIESPEDRIDRKAKAVAAREASIRELANAVFDVPSLRTIPEPVLVGLEERLILAETSYRKRERAGVSEDSIVRVIDELAQTFGAPEYARTSQDEVRILRLIISSGMPHFIPHQPLPPPTSSAQQISFSIDPVLSPIEALYVIQHIILQKQLNESFQLTRAERADVDTILLRLDERFRLSPYERARVRIGLVHQKLNEGLPQMTPEELAVAAKTRQEQGAGLASHRLTFTSSPRYEQMQVVLRRVNALSVGETITVTQRLLGILGL